VRAVGSHSASIGLLLALGALVEGCSQPPAPPPPDVQTLAAPDAATAAPRARRRRRRAAGSRAMAAAHRPTTGAENAFDPASASESDLAFADEPDEPAPRPRPRITETGPMLPEDLGRPPEVQLDMTGGEASGPMGIDPAAVSRGFAPLLGRLQRCAEGSADEQGNMPHGRITVRLRIRADGTPLAARVSGGGGPAVFIPCVRRVVASARFAPFRGPDAFATWGFDVD
jgi:hypothetical protein